MGIFDKKEEKAQDTTTKDVVAVKEAKVVTPKESHSPQRFEKIASIISPVVSEKAHVLSSVGKYVFRVTKKANKKTIKSEVEKEHKVTVMDVNIVNIPRKRRTVARDRGYQKSYKKAIVTVKKGQHIAALETA